MEHLANKELKGINFYYKSFHTSEKKILIAKWLIFEESSYSNGTLNMKTLRGLLHV